MHAIAFLQDLAVVMIVAGLVTVVFHRLKQPVVLGYLIAGVIIGPHTPPFPLIQSQETIHTLAELGIIFLMFSLGMEFSLRKLKQVGLTAFIAASLEIILMLGVGYELGRFFGWSAMDSLFLGGILSISSTTIIIKAFAELGKTKEKFSQLVFGILIVEDILGIALVALLSGIATSGSLSASDLLATLGKLGLFLTVALVIGLLTVPRLLEFVARFKSNEMLLITVLGLCFGVCLLAAKLGYSVALGAFLIGALVAEARQIGLVERLTEPIRDMFSAVFFVAIGLLIDPKVLLDYWLPIVVITLAVIGGKVVTCSFGTFVAGHDTRTSLRVGMSLAQIGEFSFIIASLGLTLKATSPFLYPIAVAVSAITTLLTPYLIKSSDPIVSWFGRVGPKPLLSYLNVYTRWVGGLGSQKPTNQATHFIRRWSWQMALNTVLMIAIFVAAAVIAQQSPAWLPRWLADQSHMNAVLWLTATMLSLPLFIATFRKLQALGLLIADLSVSRDASGSRTVIAQLVPLAGTIILAVLVLVLSAAILPPLNVLIVLALIVAVITFLLWRTFIRLYSKAQIALAETFAQAPAHASAHEQPPINDLLAEAQLTPIRIAPGSPAANKLISELRLRTLTGASIVAIQRDGNKIINPGPDEELLPGDQLLLLGSSAHMTKAVELLRAPIANDPPEAPVE